MIKNLVHGKWVTDTEWRIEWMYDENGGFSFPCDEQGNISPDLSPDAMANLEWCRQHPEKFATVGKLVPYRREWKEPDQGTCVCGETVILENQYYGACECPKCGRWYNVFGQSLRPPKDWDFDPSEEDDF